MTDEAKKYRLSQATRDACQSSDGRAAARSAGLRREHQVQAGDGQAFPEGAVGDAGRSASEVAQGGASGRVPTV